MTRRLRPLWCVPFALLATGCKHPPSVVGQWKGTVLQVDSSAEFKEDKSVIVNMNQSGMGASLVGTYEVTAKELSVTINDYKLKSVPETLSPLAKSFFDPLKGKALKLAYHFNGEDELALTYNGKTDVLKREVANE